LYKDRRKAKISKKARTEEINTEKQKARSMDGRMDG
jgi:hypothetical protein